MLHACNFVTSCPIVFCNFCFNDHLGIEFIWYYEIRCLIESRNSLRAFRLSEAHSCGGQYTLNSGFEYVADKLRYRIPVSGERPTQKSFIKKHCVRYTEIC